MVKLMALSKNNPSLLPSLGKMCVANYPKDGKWYRALVKSYMSVEIAANVIYVDYGNEETVKMCHLVPLDERFASHRPMAVQMCLSGIRPFPR